MKNLIFKNLVLATLLSAGLAYSCKDTDNILPAENTELNMAYWFAKAKPVDNSKLNLITLSATSVVGTLGHVDLDNQFRGLQNGQLADVIMSLNGKSVPPENTTTIYYYLDKDNIVDASIFGRKISYQIQEVS